MPPFGRAMGFGFGGGGGATGGSAMRQNPGLGPSMKMGMQQRMQRHAQQGYPPPGRMGWGSPQGPGMGMSGGNPTPPAWGRMNQNPQRSIPNDWRERMQNGGVAGPMRPQMPQRPDMQRPPGYGEGTGSNSRDSSDWAARNPNDPGPMAPRQIPDLSQNYERMKQLMEQMGRNPAQQPQAPQPYSPDRAYALGGQRSQIPMAERNAMMQNQPQGRPQYDPSNMMGAMQQRRQMY